MEALGRVVERSNGAEVRGDGLPNPVGTTDNIGRMAFSSIESLGGIAEHGDMRGLPDGGQERMGSSVESLHRLLERSTPARGFVGRGSEGPESPGGTTDLIEQQKLGGTLDVGKNRDLSVLRHGDKGQETDAAMNDGGPEPSPEQVGIIEELSEVNTSEVEPVQNQRSPIVTSDFAAIDQRSHGQTSPDEGREEYLNQEPPIIPQSVNSTNPSNAHGLLSGETRSTTGLNTVKMHSQDDSAQDSEALSVPPGMTDALPAPTAQHPSLQAETQESSLLKDDRQVAQSEPKSLGENLAQTKIDQGVGMRNQGADQQGATTLHALDEQRLPDEVLETNGEVSGSQPGDNENVGEQDRGDLQGLSDEDKVGFLML